MKAKLLYSSSVLIFVFTFSIEDAKLEKDSYASLLNFIRAPFDQYKLKRVLKSSEVSLDCSNALNDLYAIENYNNSKQFFDAWSSLPAGQLVGVSTSFGSFEECQAATLKSSQSGKNLHGRYSNLMASIWSNEDNGTETSESFLFSFGICLPNPCKADDIEKIFSNYFDTTEKLLDFFGLVSNNETIENRIQIVVIGNSEDNISNRDLIAAKMGIVVFSFIAILVICSSFYELILSKVNGKINPLWKSFSLLSNGRYLFHIDTKHSMSPNMIECLNGIRSLSLIWNIYGHTYLWITQRPDMNTILRNETFRSKYTGFIIAANLSVDSFLLLSGLLVTWTGLNRMNKRNGKINIRLMYLHRYLRLTPSYAATILFAAGLYVFLGTGPYWHDYTLHLSKTCQKYWWRSVFYISNYFPFGQMCMGHSWFLAVDMQLFLFVPFILMGLWKCPKKICSILVVLIILSGILVFMAILSIGESSFELDEETITRQSEFDRVRYPTEMRASTWLIGVLLGYLLFQQRHWKRKLSNLKLFIGWFLWLTFIVGILIVPKLFYQRNIKPTPLESALYESFAHFGWALSLGWIIYSCYMGYSNFINSFLSHPMWQLVAKLNYTIYLVKTFMNINNLALQKTASHYSHYTMIVEFWADFGISSSFAVLLSLMVELPFMALENHFLSSFSSQ